MTRLSKDQLATISDVVALSNGHKVVLIEVAGRKDLPPSEHNRNIYCIDGSGNVIWQIRADGEIYERDSFVSLSGSEGGSLRADRFFGSEFILDPTSGVATRVGWHK